jgi:hypothetical protein
MLYQVQHPKSTDSRVIFIEPTIVNSHCNIMNDALNINIGIFCNDMLKGREKWLNEYEDRDVYKENLKNFSTVSLIDSILILAAVL